MSEATKTVPAVTEPATVAGSAMSKLSRTGQRFARALFEVKSGAGCEIAAASLAGIKAKTPAALKEQASRLLNDPNMVPAVLELAREKYLLEAPKMLETHRDIINNVHHKDRASALKQWLERAMPVTTNIHIKSETIDHTQMALDHLKRLKSRKHMTRELLIEEFGKDGLDRWERLLAEREATKARIIEGDFTEIAPEPECGTEEDFQAVSEDEHFEIDLSEPE